MCWLSVYGIALLEPKASNHVCSFLISYFTLLYVPLLCICVHDYIRMYYVHVQILLLIVYMRTYVRAYVDDKDYTILCLCAENRHGENKQGSHGEFSS
jgi:putative effector of murein hydrolase LrgA (UPF0299 family)